MPPPECKLCKTKVSAHIDYDHRCFECNVRLCRACDDRTMFLKWYEDVLTGVDKYLCDACIKAKPKGNPTE
jgi:hypothetical protein